MNYSDWLGATDLGSDVVGDPSGPTDPTSGSDNRDELPIWRRSPGWPSTDEWSLVGPDTAARREQNRRTRVQQILERARLAEDDIDDTDMENDENEDGMDMDHDREHENGNGGVASGLTWRRVGTMDLRFADIDPASDSTARVARRRALLNALRQEMPETRVREIMDADHTVPEDIIDAGEVPDYVPSTSFTAPTNTAATASLPGFTPAVVGVLRSEASSSAGRSPMITPLPTAPGPSRTAFKRRRTATTSDSREAQLRRSSASDGHGLAALPVLSSEDLPAYMQASRTPITAIPTELNEKDMCQRLAVSSAKDSHYTLQVEFVGDGKGGDADAAAVRANRPIPRGCGVFYYEAEVISQGKHGYIAIGMCCRSTRLDRLTGWEQGSFAWHLDDGFVFESQGQGTNLGWPKSGTGDVIGCGLDVDGTVFFTKNGSFIGEAFKVPDKLDELYPAVGLRSPREFLRLNFGLNAPFRYDIASHVKRAQARIQAEIASTQVQITRPVATAEELAGSAPDSAENLATPGVSTPATDDVDAKPVAKKPRGARDNVQAIPRPMLEDRKKACEAESLARQTARRVLTDIDTPLGDVVLDYLRHSGFLGAAGALRPAMEARRRNLATGISEAPVLSDVQAGAAEDEESGRLTAVWKACRWSDLPSLLRILQSHYPKVLSDPDGTFSINWPLKLRLLGFYHLVTSHWAGSTFEKWDSVLDFLVPERERAVALEGFDLVMEVGTSLQASYGTSTDQETRRSLADAFALLAYTEAESVPAALMHPFSDTAREKVADDLLKDIRAQRGERPESVLEQAFRQTSQSLAHLRSGVGVSAAAYADAGLDVARS